MIKDIPIGLDATGTHQEFDSIGHVEVPATDIGVRRPSARCTTSRSAMTACQTRSITRMAASRRRARHDAAAEDPIRRLTN
jgi:hypothetical protein